MWYVLLTDCHKEDVLRPVGSSETSVLVPNDEVIVLSVTESHEPEEIPTKPSR